MGEKLDTSTRSVALTERDHELLRSVYDYRYLSIGQLKRLHFPSEQTANRRVRLLAGAGYITDFKPVGSDERLVTLAEKGAEFVAGQLALPMSEIDWQAKREKPKDYYFLKHFICLNDFRIAVTAACAAGRDVELLGFIPEYQGEKTKQGGVRKYLRDVAADTQSAKGQITHTPDAVFALRKNGTAALFFVEVDRGTEVLSDGEQGFLKTIRFYLNYLVGEGYQRYKVDFQVEQDFRGFRVLVVTTTKRRLVNMRKLAESFAFEPEHTKRFIWLSQMDGIDSSNILSITWASLAPNDELAYAIVPAS